ncbi:MAG: transglycosylase SLT domain-containing protein [Nitrospirota bacterium]|nr:transglycosylase SLT domain-containing protein [Nitrospirota bacterium]
MKPCKIFSSRSFRLKTAFFTCISFFLLLINAGNGDTDGKGYFRQGREDLEAARYSQAVSNLSLAQGEFSLLEDYTLYYLAEAYHGLGEHEKSLETLRSLLGRFPATPLKKKARMAEIREAKESNKSDVLSLFEAYIKDYQGDEEALFLYAKMLGETGDAAKAAKVFKQIYTEAGEFSRAALAELNTGDISAKDILERASNLFKRYDFADAERDLRQALQKDSGDARSELLNKLGYSLFRQKKYPEAAELYGRIDDLYYRARSLYRAGDRKGFDEALASLIARHDKSAGYLLTAVAADKRREKDFEGALTTYSEVLRNYPSDAEEALWGIGWTQYLSGDYAKSAMTFSQLYEKYDELKYLYWQARSLEADGRNAAELYSKLLQADNNFYNVMSHAMNKKPLTRPASLKPSVPDIPLDNPGSSKRIDAMISLGMEKEAILELTFASKKIDTPSELIYLISKFQELGEFRRAIALAVRMPYSERMHAFWYPLAYWDTVEPAAKRYNIDPLVALSVMREESRFDANAKSVAGAYGLMQLMPQTAYRLDRNLKLGINRPSQLTVVRNNIHLGSFYLRSLFNEFHSLPHVLAAYNAGELAVRSWQARGEYKAVDEFIEDIPYAETRNYVKKVITSYFQYKKLSSVDTEGAVVDIILGEL